MKSNLAHELTENGYVPDSLIRHGIRALLKQRLREIRADDIEHTADAQAEFIAAMDRSPVALVPERANEQHYEIPQAFYEQVLGKYGKYSCCYWPEGTRSLDDAELRGLELTCEHAGLEDGMRVLELGCGWGSLTLHIARTYPNSTITAVSNSASQGQYIRDRAVSEGLRNVTVITADMNDFDTEETFDRVVSVEMFEHMRNHRGLMNRVCRWLELDGKFFMHIFVHRNTPYLFEDKDETDWMTRFFFDGGMMPSDDLPLFFQDHLRLEQRWRWNGCHYQKTAEAWLKNMDDNRDQVWPVLEKVYGKDFAKTWFMRWRMFFLAVSELFGYDDGNEWYVSHYTFRKRAF